MGNFEIILLINGKIIQRCKNSKEAEKFIENHETPNLIEVNFSESFRQRIKLMEKEKKE